MANPNHDERGRFSSGDSVTIGGPLAGKLGGAKGKIIGPSPMGNGYHIVKLDGGRKLRTIHQNFLTKADTSPGGKATERLQAFHEKMQDPAYHAAREARMREKDAQNAELKLTTRKDAAAIGKLRKLNAAAGKPTDYGTLNRKLKKLKKSKYGGAYTIGDQDL